MIRKTLFLAAIAVSIVAGIAGSGAAYAAPLKRASCRLLLVNDDGIDAVGIHALYQALKDDCELVVAAPAAQQSGMSHATPNLQELAHLYGGSLALGRSETLGGLAAEVLLPRSS